MNERAGQVLLVLMTSRQGSKEKKFCITGRILATLAVFFSYMLENLVASSPFQLGSQSDHCMFNSGQIADGRIAFARHHLQVVCGGVRAVPGRLRHHRRIGDADETT